jgi:hypothetical protein
MRKALSQLGAALFFVAAAGAGYPASAGFADQENSGGGTPIVQLRQDVEEVSMPPPPSGPATPSPFCTPSLPICP